MNIQEWLKETYNLRKSGMLDIRPKLKCKDGFEMSVQASEYHYCDPKKTY